MKSGIPYFPLDVDLDDKFKLIEAEFGLIGFAVIVKLFQKAYGQQGYYCEYTNEVALLFSSSCGLGGNVVSEIVGAAIRRGIFDKTLYDKYKILTSVGIQKRYFEAVSRRINVEVESQYLLLNAIQNYKNVSIKAKNVNIFDKNDNILQQSNVEKSRVKKKDISSAYADDPPNNKDIFADDSDEIKICKYLISKILSNNPKAKVPEGIKIQQWAEHIDKLIRLDKHTKREIVAVINYCQADSFWKSNILSTKKLRDKFDTLWLQCQEKGDKKNAEHSGTSPGQTPKFDKSKFLAK